MTNKITEEELAEIREKNRGSRSYTNGEVTVYWRPHLCIHSAECLIGLPEVFNNSIRPWIDPSKATSEEIIKVINTCPSRALTFLQNKGKEAAEEPAASMDKATAVKVQILRNGPALIRGNYIIMDAAGNEIKSEHEVAAICRCGSSKKKPFCDGTHQKAGFKD